MFDSTQDNKSKTPKTENTEHSNPYSYAWMVMRLAIMQLVQEQLHGFLTIAAIDLQGIINRTFTFFKYYCYGVIFYVIHLVFT